MFVGSTPTAGTKVWPSGGMAYATALKAVDFGHVGSSPTWATKFKNCESKRLMKCKHCGRTKGEHSWQALYCPRYDKLGRVGFYTCKYEPEGKANERQSATIQRYEERL